MRAPSQSHTHTPSFLLLRSGADWQHLRVGISVQQFEQMKARLNGKPSRGVSPSAVNTRRISGGPQTIIGIDPSLRGTGYGIIRAGKLQPVVLAQGTIACPKDWARSRCLAKISKTLFDLLLEQ